MPTYRDKVTLVDPNHVEEVRELLTTFDVLLMSSKFVASGTTGDIIPANGLLETWDADVHITQYVTDYPWRAAKHEPSRMEGEELDEYDKRCERAQDHSGYKATMMIFDLDAHGEVAATEEDWWHLVYKAILYCAPGDNQPNFIVKTKNGAHLYYIIKPITDPMLFEARRMKLLKKLKRDWKHNLKYAFDETKDWTRCFRAPRVLRSDKKDEGWVQTDLRDSLIWCIHNNVLDTSTNKWWEVQPDPLPARDGKGSFKYTGKDAKIEAFTKTGPDTGQRYNETRDMAWYIKHQYVPSDWERLQETIVDRAVELGLPRHEAEHATKILRTTR